MGEQGKPKGRQARGKSRRRTKGRSVEQAWAQKKEREGKAVDERQIKLSSQVTVRHVDPETLRKSDA